MITPDNTCCWCPERAVGVYIREVADSDENVGHKSTKLMCSECRNSYRDENEDEWEHGEFRRFVD